MVRPVSLLALATAVPPHAIDQSDVVRVAPSFFPDLFRDHPALPEVFTHTGIERRHMARPLSWFFETHDWKDRTEAYLETASALFLSASRQAIDRARLDPAEIDIVVTVSSTGIATPSLDARVASELGLRPDVRRVPLFGLGCAGGVTGLATAARLARGEPGATVLLVAVELCTLAFRFDGASRIEVIATALFGDGAAAAVLRADEANPGEARFGHAAEHLWPDTLDIMGWSVDPVGFGVVLSQTLPHFLQEHLAAPARDFIESLGGNGRPPRLVCHLGSEKVLTAIETALDLAPGTLADERAVLREHGNMSSPSVLFVLERALARGQTGPAVLAALGPGFTASFLSAELGNG
jgi:alkylresorcinol/alkylpyrone synthase